MARIKIFRYSAPQEAGNPLVATQTMQDSTWLQKCCWPRHQRQCGDAGQSVCFCDPDDAGAACSGLSCAPQDAQAARAAGGIAPASSAPGGTYAC